MTEEDQQLPQAPADDLANQPHAEVATYIAEQLGETEEAPRRQIASIVRAGGRTQALGMLDHTLRIEAAGGMLLPDGSRRRTPGGVYFYLAFSVGRNKAGGKLQRLPAPGQARPKPASPQAQAAQPAPAPVFTWDDRKAAIEEIGNEKGRVTTVKITLIGTLGKYTDKGTCVVGVMQHTGERFPALPKGVPAPQQARTNYIVYIGAKQWKNVAAAAMDKEDELIIEGFPQIDSKTGAISVFVSSVTSKKLQAAKRQG